MSKLALERGGGRAQKATHGNGCRHYGILELKAMNGSNYKFYSKNDGWLVGKKCIGCDKSTSCMTLDKHTDSFLMYCEMGLKSMKIKKNDNSTEMESFLDHDCNMILCITCYKVKVVEHEQHMTVDKCGRSKRCSARKKNCYFCVNCSVCGYKMLLKN